MGLFEAAMQLCDDCGVKAGDLRWWGDHVRICAPCRARRMASGRSALPRTKSRSHDASSPSGEASAGNPATDEKPPSTTRNDEDTTA